MTNVCHWVDSSELRNDAKNLTLLNKSFECIKKRKIFVIVWTFWRIHPLQHMNYVNSINAVVYEKKIADEKDYNF